MPQKKPHHHAIDLRKFPSLCHESFRACAHATARAAGSAWAFGVSLLVILGWAATGPMFHFSDTWQLVINTATTIITFLMVFLIQNTQNRDTRAIHLKLDELLRGVSGARTKLVNLEELSDEELDHLQAEFKALLARKGASALPKAGRSFSRANH